MDGTNQDGTDGMVGEVQKLETMVRNAGNQVTIMRMGITRDNGVLIMPNPTTTKEREHHRALPAKEKVSIVQ